MTHRALVQRPTTTVDAYNNAQPPTWSTLHAELACYYWQPATGQGEQQGVRNVRLYGHQMLVPLGTDITESDRIVGVVDRRGYAVSADTFGIVAIVRKADHVLLSLEVIK